MQNVDKHSKTRLLWPGILALVLIAVFGVLFGIYHRRTPFQFRPAPESSEPTETDPSLSIEEVTVDLEALRHTVEILSKYPSRVTGYPGADSAAAWIKEEFIRIGLSSVATMPFEALVPLDRGAKLEVLPEGPAFEVFGLWPNLVRTPTLPQEGVRGKLVYGGDGELADFNGQDVDGQIILMEFDSGMNWLNAFDLGAEAILFVEPDEADRSEAEQKFLSVPADLPRFWVPREASDRLKSYLGEEVKLTGRMDWEEAWGINIVGIVKGSDPQLRDHAIILEAYYDASSVVPAQAPGGEAAAGVAVLLETAKYLASHPPARTVIFLASSAHFETLMGIRSFVALLDGGMSGLEEKQSELEDRLAFLDDYTISLNTDLFQAISDKKFTSQVLREVRLDALQLVTVFEGQLQVDLDDSKRADVRRMLDVLRPLRWVEDVSEIEVLSQYPDALSVILERKADEIQQIRYELIAMEQQADFLKALSSYRLDACLGLDLSTGSDKVGIFGQGGFYDFGPGWGNSRNNHDDSPFYNEIMAAGSQVEAELASVEFGEPPFFFDGIYYSRERKDLGGLTNLLAFNSGPLNCWGLLSVTLATLNDARLALDTPLDRPDRMNFPNLARQARFIIPLVRCVADNPKIAMIEKGEDFFGYLSGQVVKFDPKTGFVPDAPVPGSIVRMRLVKKTIVGVRSEPMAMANYRGKFLMPGIIHSTLYLQPSNVEVYHLNAWDGAVDYASDLGINGAERYPLVFNMDRKYKEATIVAFRAKGVTIFETLEYRYFDVLNNISVLEAGREAVPVEFGYVLPLHPMAHHLADIYFDYHIRWTTDVVKSLAEPCAVVFAHSGSRIKITMTMGKYGIGNRFLLLNSSPENPTGEGFPVSERGRLSHISYQVAHDIYQLNDMRIRNLLEHGVRNNRLQQMHQRTGHYLDVAEKALKDREYDRFGEASRLAWTYGNRAYGDVHGTTRDVVQGVLFYMALLIPFAYFGERLLLAGPTIKKQIAGIAGIFLLAFIMLRWVHPAFELTLNPGIILLGFVIFGLSVLVISIGFSKMQQQIRLAVSRIVGVHRADVNRVSAVWSAFNLGINNMRRRKVRTLLTLLTIILVTFSVLSFTSVRTLLRFNKVPTRGEASYNGLLVRRTGWEPLNQQVYESIRNLYRDQVVAPRAWFMPGYEKPLWQRSKMSIERSDDTRKKVTVEAVLGLTPQESELTHPQSTLYAGRGFKPGEENVCILSSSVAKLLQIGPSDIGRAKVKIAGEVFSTVGLADVELFNNLLDLNNEPITPLDPQAQQPIEKGDAVADQMLRSNQLSFVHLSSEQLIIIPYSVVTRLGGAIQSVAIGFESARAVEKAIETWMPGLQVNLFAGIDGKKYLLNAVGLQSLGGLSNVAIYWTL